jgi:hypothetical protein
MAKVAAVPPFTDPAPIELFDDDVFIVIVVAVAVTEMLVVPLFVGLLFVVVDVIVVVAIAPSAAETIAVGDDGDDDDDAAKGGRTPKRARVGGDEIDGKPLALSASVSLRDGCKRESIAILTESDDDDIGNGFNNGVIGVGRRDDGGVWWRTGRIGSLSNACDGDDVAEVVECVVETGVGVTLAGPAKGGKARPPPRNKGGRDIIGGTIVNGVNDDDVAGLSITVAWRGGVPGVGDTVDETDAAVAGGTILVDEVVVEADDGTGATVAVDSEVAAAKPRKDVVGDDVAVVDVEDDDGHGNAFDVLIGLPFAFNGGEETCGINSPGLSNASWACCLVGVLGNDVADDDDDASVWWLLIIDTGGGVIMTGDGGADCINVVEPVVEIGNIGSVDKANGTWAAAAPRPLSVVDDDEVGITCDDNDEDDVADNDKVECAIAASTAAVWSGMDIPACNIALRNAFLIFNFADCAGVTPREPARTACSICGLTCNIDRRCPVLLLLLPFNTFNAFEPGNNEANRTIFANRPAGWLDFNLFQLASIISAWRFTSPFKIRIIAFNFCSLCCDFCKSRVNWSAIFCNRVDATL